jgi:hypothetical protein
MDTASRDLQTLFRVGAIGNLSNGTLLEQFIGSRSEAAFGVLLERHGPRVGGVCRRVLSDHHDVEDAFQAAFLVMARKAASVDPRESVGNWLYGVANRTALKAKAPGEDALQEAAVTGGRPVAAPVRKPSGSFKDKIVLFGTLRDDRFTS